MLDYLRSEPYFVTAADFRAKFGIDLATIRGFDNISNKANIFLIDVENELMDWVDDNSFRVTPWEGLTQFQRSKMREAVLKQAYYEYRNGKISMDSGYDPEKGKVADPEYLERIEVCAPAKRALQTGGLFNQSIQNRVRIIRLR